MSGPTAVIGFLYRIGTNPIQLGSNERCIPWNVLKTVDLKAREHGAISEPILLSANSAWADEFF